MNHLTVVGNLVADPELRFTKTGKAVANFTIAVNRRIRNAEGMWQDGDVMYLRSVAWNISAQNVAESLRKGDRVIATGEMTVTEFEGKDGTKRTSPELRVTEIGASLWRATVTVNRPTSGADF